MEKFDSVLNHPETHAEHIELLQRQLTAIPDALSEIPAYRHRLDNTKAR